jgi:sterol desaturase/sphingolipid hydroxylase (fatty acid hydroxylase superfamily)
MTLSAIAPILLLGLALTAPLWVMGLVRAGLERYWPAHAPRPADDRLNLGVWLAYVAAPFALGPACGALITLAINAAGGGLIVLPASGFSLIAGAAIYLVVMDFGEYAFHRAQHAIPALWAMHSLHHSDPHFDTTTSVRHFWLEPVIKSVTIWLAVALTFKAAPAIVALYTAASFYNMVIHSNTRLHLGRASWLINTPAYHRLHHSASPEHWDCNFAALLPVFDLIFGGYRAPRADERPRTGLDSGEAPQGLIQATLWPLRSWMPKSAPRAETIADA